MLLNYRPTQDISKKIDSFEGKRLYFYEKGELIPLAASGLWQVYQGAVQLSKLDAAGEDEIILGWAIAETCFGMWMTDIPTYQAEAISDVYLRWFSQSEIEASPVLAHTLIEQLSRRLIKAEELLSIVGMRRVEDRLWQLLLFLKKELGKETKAGTRIQVRFTHQNLANAICTTRVTVTRILGTFQDRGLIEWDSDRHLIVKALF
jgi:CRP-like cAMP-binding protein